MNMNSNPNPSDSVVRGATNPAPAPDRSSSERQSPPNSPDLRSPSFPGQETGTQQAETSSPPKPPRRRLDAAAKALVCKYVAQGHSIAAAARLVGFSERTIYKCRHRDALFRLQLNKGEERVASACLKALRKAVVTEGDWRAGLHYMRLTYPDRYHYRPEIITRKQYETWNAELMRLLSQIVTPEQLRELHRRFEEAAKAP
jgi:hypothetical protein